MTTMTNDTYIEKEFGTLVGRKIVAVRPLRQAELEDMCWEDGWGSIGFAIILDDGQVLMPSSDPEGNGPGHILMADLA
jgi:hypothetical protein